MEKRFKVSYNYEDLTLHIFINDKLVNVNGDILKSEPIRLPNKFESHSWVIYLLGDVTIQI